QFPLFLPPRSVQTAPPRARREQIVWVDDSPTGFRGEPSSKAPSAPWRSWRSPSDGGHAKLDRYFSSLPSRTHRPLTMDVCFSQRCNNGRDKVMRRLSKERRDESVRSANL